MLQFCNDPVRPRTQRGIRLTIRSAELLMALALALLSIGFMVKATDGLSIWWVPGTGPGSGVWPFWLSLLMLLSCISIAVRWFFGVTPQSRSTEMFMDRHAVQIVGVTVAALFMLILGMYFIGIYFSLIFFLFFYLRILGGHSWKLTIVLMLGIPIFIFFFFEYLLTIPLPKGEWIPDRVYIPLYRIMYGY
jgi:putative tricarboxylic transport membrane protein